MTLATVQVHLPDVLVQLLGVHSPFPLQAETLAQALNRLREDHPNLSPHLYDESGNFRPHVLCFLNDTSSRWLDSLEIPLNEGDEITFLQAVSGG